MQLLRYAVGHAYSNENLYSPGKTGSNNMKRKKGGKERNKLMETNTLTHYKYITNMKQNIP